MAYLWIHMNMISSEIQLGIRLDLIWLEIYLTILLKPILLEIYLKYICILIEPSWVPETLVGFLDSFSAEFFIRACKR